MLSSKNNFTAPYYSCHGEMAEWFKAHAWKVCIRGTVSWVRIPLSPPLFELSAEEDLNVSTD